MLREKQMNHDVERIECGKNINARQLKLDILELAEANEIPLIAELEQLKVGGIFNSQILDCVVLKHPKHVYDYLNVVVTPINNGNEIMFCSMGMSKQQTKQAKLLMGRGTFGFSRKKLESESDYYDKVCALIGSCIR